MNKLTPARRAMLMDLLDGPKTGADHYAPNKWAVANGYATRRDARFGGSIYEITDAGRRLVAES